MQSPFPAAGQPGLDVLLALLASLPRQAAEESPLSLAPQAHTSLTQTQPGQQSLGPASSPLPPQSDSSLVPTAAEPAVGQSPHPAHQPQANMPADSSTSHAVRSAAWLAKSLSPHLDSQRARRGWGAMTHPFAAAGASSHADKLPQAVPADPSLAGPENYLQACAYQVNMAHALKNCLPADSMITVSQ